MIRSFLRRLFPEPTPAERLAAMFAVHPDHVRRALDRTGDEPHATLLLLYAASNGRSVDGALEDFGAHHGPERLREGLTIWADCVEGRRVLLSWQMAQAAPASLRLRIAGAIDRRLRRAWLGAAERGAAKAAGGVS